MKFNIYLRQFAILRVDTNHKRWTSITTFRAPHKPLLLLSILDLFAQGLIPTNLIEVTPELGSMFADYWSQVFPDGRRGNVALPFFHLRSSPFWHLVPRPGQEAHLAEIRQIDSLGHLDRTVIGATLDEDLFNLLQSEQAREVLRGVLIKEYFTPELHPILIAQSIVNLKAFKYGKQLIEASRRQAHDQFGSDEPQYVVRDQGFRRTIVQLFSTAVLSVAYV